MHDEALARAPQRRGADFEAQLHAVIARLTELLGEMPNETTQSEQWARTHRATADALFDLADGHVPQILGQARALYVSADRLLGPGPSRERAALDANWANTLLGLSGGGDGSLIDEALARYARARPWFVDHQPAHVAMIDHAVRSAEAMRAVAQLQAGTEQYLARLEHDAAPLPTLQARASATDARVGNTAIPSTDTETILAQLEQRIANDRANGTITDQRAALLFQLLEQQRVSAEADEDTVGDVARKLERQQGLMGRIALLDPSPTGGGPLAGSRAARVYELWGRLREQLMSITGRRHAGRQTRAAVQGMLWEVGTAYSEFVHVQDDDDAARRLERDRLLPVVRDARAHELAHNLTLAEPRFSGTKELGPANEVFFSGSDAARAIVEAAVAKTGLVLQGPSGGVHYAEDRWRQLRRAHVAVFDFQSSLDPVSRAAIAYEYGLCLAVGTRAVVLRDAARLPFDVAVEAVELVGDARDVLALGMALDEAAYGVSPTAGACAGLVATTRAMLARFGSSTVPGLPEMLRSTAAQAAADPDAQEIRSQLAAALSVSTDRSALLLTPRFAPQYPDDGPRVFHVMPFGPSWATPISVLVEGWCGPAAKYVRHDHVQDNRIIDSLWEEIGRASHIVVDLTGFNPNVAIELGLADALGKPTLLVAHQGTVVAGLPRPLEKVRVEEYDPNGPDALERAIRKFLRLGPVRPAAQSNVRPGPAASAAKPRHGLQQIREQFERAIAEDTRSQRLLRILQTNRWLTSYGVDLPAMVGFTRSYVSSVPDMLDKTWQLASERGVAHEIAPFLAQIERYCQEPSDVIADEHGLAGLADDAYLARQVLLGLRWRRANMRPDHEEARIEAAMRNLVIGEPFATQLDQIVAQIVVGPQAEQALASFANAGVTEPWITTLGDIAVTEEVNAMLGAIGVV